MSKRVLNILRKEFGDAILETHSQLGDDTAVVAVDKWKEVARFLKNDRRTAMNHFIDLTAVDYLGRRTPRFEVVLHVRSVEKAHRVRLKARLEGPPMGDETSQQGLQIDTLSDVWAGANWFEREAYDMFGVDFVGHPDLRRILMYEEFLGHPLRKDYDARRTQPLVEYRSEAVDRLPPFDAHEGMPFGRQTHVSPFARGRRRSLLSSGSEQGHQEGDGQDGEA